MHCTHRNYIFHAGDTSILPVTFCGEQIGSQVTVIVSVAEGMNEVEEEEKGRDKMG